MVLVQLKNEIEALEADRLAQQPAVQALEAETKVLNQEIQALNKQHGALQSDIRALKQEGQAVAEEVLFHPLHSYLICELRLLWAVSILMLEVLWPSGSCNNMLCKESKCLMYF